MPRVQKTRNRSGAPSARLKTILTEELLMSIINIQLTGMRSASSGVSMARTYALSGKVVFCQPYKVSLLTHPAPLRRSDPEEWCASFSLTRDAHPTRDLGRKLSRRNRTVGEGTHRLDYGTIQNDGQLQEHRRGVPLLRTSCARQLLWTSGNPTGVSFCVRCQLLCSVPAVWTPVVSPVLLCLTYVSYWLLYRDSHRRNVW